MRLSLVVLFELKYLSRKFGSICKRKDELKLHSGLKHSLSVREPGKAIKYGIVRILVSCQIIYWKKNNVSFHCGSIVLKFYSKLSRSTVESSSLPIMLEMSNYKRFTWELISLLDYLVMIAQRSMLSNECLFMYSLPHCMLHTIENTCFYS